MMASERTPELNLHCSANPAGEDRRTVAVAESLQPRRGLLLPLLPRFSAAEQIPRCRETLAAISALWGVWHSWSLDGFPAACLRINQRASHRPPGAQAESWSSPARAKSAQRSMGGMPGWATSRANRCLNPIASICADALMLRRRGGGDARAVQPALCSPSAIDSARVRRCEHGA